MNDAIKKAESKKQHVEFVDNKDSKWLNSKIDAMTILYILGNYISETGLSENIKLLTVDDDKKSVDTNEKVAFEISFLGSDDGFSDVNFLTLKFNKSLSVRDIVKGTCFVINQRIDYNNSVIDKSNKVSILKNDLNKLQAILK